MHVFRKRTAKKPAVFFMKITLTVRRPGEAGARLKGIIPSGFSSYVSQSVEPSYKDRTFDSNFYAFQIYVRGILCGQGDFGIVALDGLAAFLLSGIS